VGIGADEAVPASLKLGWDAKRDKYAGFDTTEHQKVVARYDTIEKERILLKEEERKKAAEAAALKQEEKVQRRARREAKAAERAAKKAAKAEQSAIDENAATDSEASDGSSDSDFSSSDDEGGKRRRKGRGAAGAEGEVGARARSGSQDSGRSAGSGGAGGGAKMISWNVRTREDTAKYLLNLDTESAFYDPKTRSMRENPFADGDPRAAAYGYEGDNAVKGSGQVADLASDQLFAWEAYNRGADVHLQANPTQVALLKQQFAHRKEAVRKLMASKLADKYGGSAAGTDPDVEAPDSLPAELRLGGGAESEVYREYHPAIAPDGRIVPIEVIPDRSSTVPKQNGGAGSSSNADAGSSSFAQGAGGSLGSRSRYPEDQCPSNHTSIYGSWFDKEAKLWGFACCHQTLYGSYCTGEAGKRARVDADTFHANASAAHAHAMEERTQLALKRKIEADAQGKVTAVHEEERARKKARPGDPLYEEQP
jgi:pre-mRNA-processing factor SLU7